MMSQNTIIFIPVLPWCPPLSHDCKFGLWQLFFFCFFILKHKTRMFNRELLLCLLLSLLSFFLPLSYLLCTSLSLHIPTWHPWRCLKSLLLRRQLLLCVREGSVWHKSHWVLFRFHFHLHINSIKRWSTGSWDHKVFVRLLWHVGVSWVSPANITMFWLFWSESKVHLPLFRSQSDRLPLVVRTYSCNATTCFSSRHLIFIKNVWRRLNL